MKKILSLVLVLVMVLGLSVPAFATESDGTWSYDPNTNTFTVNCTIPKKATLNTAIPTEVSITSTGDITGISGLFALWGKTSEENGYLYDSRNWIPAINKDDPNAVFKANTEYGYIIAVAYVPNVLQKDLSAAKIVLNGKKYSEIGVSVAYNSQNEYAEAFIVVDFGTLNADGSFTGGDFAEASTNKSGTTTITATKAAPFSYEIVIPTNVAGITAAGVYEVGQAKVENVVSATDKTVISYTATTGDFKLSTDTSKTMAATYYTEQAATNVFPTAAVTVYENKADAASIPTMWVKIAEDDWNAAEAGTYTATVTYNFSAEEVVTIADILPDDFPVKNGEETPDNAWVVVGEEEEENACMLVEGDNLCWDALSFPLTTALTKESDNKYTCFFSEEEYSLTLAFNLEGGILQSIVLTAQMGDKTDTFTFTEPQPV